MISLHVVLPLFPLCKQGLREHIPTLPYEKRLSKVDTLKLAIGYINFLAETLTTGRNPNDASSRPPVEQPKKVLQYHRHGSPCHNSPCSSSVAGSTDLIVHSLSWKNEHAVPHNGSKMLTKLWMPEDPRRKKNASTTSSASSDIFSSPEPMPLSAQTVPLRSACQHHQDILAECCDALTKSP